LCLLNKSFLRNRVRACVLLEIVNFYLWFYADFALNANFADELIGRLYRQAVMGAGENYFDTGSKIFPHESEDNWRYIASNIAS
jgi:hypothetical protein